MFLRSDRETGRQEIWTFDLASGQNQRATDDRWPRNDYPIWAPDGASVLYVSTRGDLAGVYRKAWDGSGSEELLFQFTPGAPIFLSDITSDGRLLVFYSSGYILAVPLEPGQDALARVAIDWIREETEARAGRVSPSSRFIAYHAREPGRSVEVHVRPFDPPVSAAGTEAAEPVRVVVGGVLGWRQDGGELYLRQDDSGSDDALVMVVDVSASQTFEAGAPRLLFRLPADRLLRQGWGSELSVSGDGQRFVTNLTVQEPRPVGVSEGRAGTPR